VLLLLKPEVYHSDPVGMSDTRFQAATLVCKIFLRFLDQLPNRTGMLPLWLRILDILDRMMNSGQGDSLVSQPFLRIQRISKPSLANSILSSNF
jgi:brefeldin A-resistance guanine nucleotide exchange factor 1